MATIAYITTITQVDDATINFEILSSVAPNPIVPVTSTFENLITSVTENMAGSFMTSPLPNSYNLTSTVAGMGATFGDSVYRCVGSFTANGGADTYNADDYFLVTTAIDAAILVYPTTTDADIARKAYIVSVRTLIDTLFGAADYTNTNNRIKQLTDILFNLGSQSLTFVATLPSPEQITITGSNAFLTTYSGGWYNVLTNTLTIVEYPYTWNFATPSQSKDVIQSFDYPDGVYTNNSSVLVSVVTGISNFSDLYAGTSYLLVTTTVDNQIALFQANYDANNTAEAIALAALLANQAAWIVAYAANDYTETNALIAQAQAILANGLSREISAALTSDADMSVFFTVPPAMPVGTYTDGSITITNTLTGVAFTYDGFPTDAADLTQALNSEDLGFGADFPDGVYQIVVTWYVDGLLFTAQCYLVVTTDWQCCIDKAAGKKCGKLNTALMQANLTNAVRIVAIYSDVNTANALISEGNRECSSCGCGCS